MNAKEPRLWEAVRDRLISDIKTGAIPVGALLPSVRQLTADFTISTTTARRALADMAAAGYARPAGTRGTIASSPDPIGDEGAQATTPCSCNTARVARAQVYVAIAGYTGEYEVLHIFARPEDAEAYDVPSEIVPMDVRDGPVETRLWHSVRWSPTRADFAEGDPKHQANPWRGSFPRDFDGQPERVEEVARDYLSVEGWDADTVNQRYEMYRERYERIGRWAESP